MVKRYIVGALALLFPIFVIAADEANPESQYVLNTGDRISIQVYGEQDLSFESIQINESGTMAYPLLGTITISRLTTRALEESLTRQLIDRDFLIRPEITVSIVEYRPFYIEGEVENPGAYPYEPGLTLRIAVSLAGGFTERASRNRITVVSATDGGAGAPVEVNSLDTPVRPGDSITVPQRLF